jgi:hypothetical protein
MESTHTGTKAVFLLEPLSCVVRLAMLRFEPVGTKIVIQNNRLLYMRPTAIQPLLRWYAGASRDDLYFVLRPIVVAKLRLDNENDDIKNIFKYAHDGLQRLKKTYMDEVNTAAHCLKLYAAYVNDEANPHDADIPKDNFTNTLYAEFDKLWTPAQINIVSLILDEAAASASENSVANYVEAIDRIVELKEDASLSLLQKYTQHLLKKSEPEIVAVDPDTVK